MKTIKTPYLLLVICILLSCSGCLIPPIFFPSTGAHGVVVDQDNKPIAGAKLKGWNRPLRFFPMSTLSYQDEIKTDKNGQWRYFVRKAENMGVYLLSQDGYERDPNAYEIAIYNYQSPTNEIVFRLIKVNPPVRTEGVK